MKKRILSILAAMLVAVSAAGCGSSETESTETTGGDTAAEETAFTVEGNVEFLVSSSAGGGSDIFTRTITDIISKEGIMDNSFVVNNMPDGNGQISRRQVKDAKGDAANATLLCFSTGDLSAMISNGGLTMADFKPIAILAADKHLMFTNAKSSKYTSFEEVVEAAKAGEQIVVGGTASDEKNIYNMLTSALGVEDNFSYITYSSASETITALLGGHIDLGIAKPAASKEYVVSGDITPVLALSSERFSEPFQDAPTAEELGYGVIELPVWRGVIGSANMSDEAVAYWNDVFKQVTETEAWATDYLEKNLLVNNYMNVEDTTATMLESEASVLEASGN